MLTAILAASALLALLSAVLFQAPELLGAKKFLTDFDAFYVAGKMAQENRANEAYQMAEMQAAQQKFTGTSGFMPWTYPPPYMLLVEGLALMPIGLAYLLFITTSFAFYLLVLRRIAGGYLPGVLIAVMPTILLVVRTGQNGFLTGGLIGCFLIAFLHKRSAAGVPLGLMIVKPHLAAGIALLALLGWRWKAMAIAAAIVIAALAAATVVFGTGIWPAFFGGVDDAGQFLALGYYPLFRMSSIYASVWAAGGSALVALVLHLAGALAGVGLLIYVWAARCEPRIVAATACATSLVVSPYNYDYDLTILGLGIAFVLRDIVERARGWELLGLLLLSWFATGYGLTSNTFFEIGKDGPVHGLSLAAPALLLLIAAIFAVLRRAESTAMANPPRTALEVKA